MEIRPYRDEDLDPTVRMWSAVMADTYTFLELHTAEEDRAYFRDVILAANDVFVAEADGQIRGYLAIQGDYIDRLYVAVDQQRRGIGTALLAHAAALSPAGLRLCTHVKNTGARAFYERHGFTAVRFGVSPPPESEPDVEYHRGPSQI